MKDLLKMTKPTLCYELFVFYSVVYKNRNINNQCETQRIDLIIFSDSFSQKLFHDVTQRHKACLSIEIPGLKVLNTQLYVNRRIKFLKKSLKTGRKQYQFFLFPITSGNTDILLSLQLEANKNTSLRKNSLCQRKLAQLVYMTFFLKNLKCNIFISHYSTKKQFSKIGQ